MPGENKFADPSDGSEGTWDVFQSVANFPTDFGLMVIPVAGPDGTPPVVAKTHAKLAMKSVSWTAKKDGKPGHIPCPEEKDGNEVLLSTALTPAVPKLLTNGLAHSWSIGGVYNYVLLRPLDPCNKGLPTGADPSDSSSATELTYPADRFRHDLMLGTNGFTE